MNKIHEKLNNHPRLKKCLKLLAVVGMCLSVLFNALILGVVIADNVRNGAESKSVNNAVTTPLVKEIGRRNDKIIVSLSELGSREAFNSVMRWCTQHNTYYEGFANCDSTHRYYNLLQDSPVSPVTNNMDNMFLIGDIGSSNDLPSNVLQARRLHFYSYLVNGAYFTEQTYYLGFGNDGNDFEIRIEWKIVSNIVNTQNVGFNDHVSDVFFSYLYYVDSGTTGTPVLDSYRLSCWFYQNSTAEEMFSYWINEDGTTGYYGGYAVGQGQGWNNGYQVGLNANPTAVNNSFNIISQAFNSVASVLNIQILPYLTLGTLVFIPIIVAVLIVVVKMIKG